MALVLGSIVTAGLISSAGDRVEVLVLARDVPRDEVLEADDLSRARVAVDGDVATVPAGEFEEMVGQVAAADLVSGALLAPEHVRSSSDRTVGAGEAIVGLVLSSSDAPLGQLRPGVEVFVVVRDPVEDEVTEVDGWLLDVGAESDESRTASVVVPVGDVGAVSSAAGEGRATVSVREI